jgi:putative ABC transport system permease protein
MAAALGLLRGEGGGLGAAFAGVFLLLLGYGLLIPLLLSFLARSIARLLLNACLPRLAVRSVAASASRAGLAVAALCIALSVGIGIGTMVDSFRSTVAQWLEQILQADIYVTAPTDGVRHSPPVPADLEAKLAQIKGVESTGSSLRRQVASSAGDSELLALEPPHLDRPGFRFQNADSHALWRGFADMRGVFVSEPYARKHGLNVGDSLQLVGDNGAVSLPVVGVFFDYRSDQGLIVIHRHLYEQLWQGWQPTAIGVYLPADTPADAVRRDVERLLAGTGQALTATSNREIRNTSLATFERTFTVTQVLRLLAVGVALVGVLGALLAFQHERRRELAVLRATGMTPAQAGRLVLWQTGFMGLAAGLFSIPLGLALALALVRVVNVRSFGWSMDFSISPAPLLASVVLAVLAALLAGLYPARLAMREQPALALREE